MTFTSHVRLVVLALFSFFVPVLAQAAPCECKDAKDMLYRIKLAKALIAAYRYQITGMETKEATTGKPLMFTPSLYGSTLQARLEVVAQQIFAAEPNPKPNDATGSTHGGTCFVTIKGGSECLREAVRRHEAYHEAICLPKKKRFFPGIWTDYRDDMRLVDVAREEIAGYDIEIAYLTKEMKAFTQECKQNLYLRFKIIVSGKGETLRGKNSISWTLKNIYSGEVELSGGKLTPSHFPGRQISLPPELTPTAQQIMNMTFEQRQESIKKEVKRVDEMKKSYVHHWGATKKPSFDVDINYIRKTTKHVRGEGSTFETWKTVETWKGTAKENLGATFIELNPRTNTYNILISIHPTGREQTIAHVTQKEIETDNPVLDYDDTQPPVKKMITPGSIQIPNVASILLSDKIHHYEKDLVFAPKEDILTFSSGKLKIDAVQPNSGTPNFTNSESLREKVTVEVEYTLSKDPAKVTPPSAPALNTSSLN